MLTISSSEHSYDYIFLKNNQQFMFCTDSSLYPSNIVKTRFYKTIFQNLLFEIFLSS